MLSFLEGRVFDAYFQILTKKSIQLALAAFGQKYKHFYHFQAIFANWEDLCGSTSGRTGGENSGGRKNVASQTLILQANFRKKMVENKLNDAYFSLTQFWPESMMLICGFSFALFQNKHHSSKS